MDRGFGYTSSIIKRNKGADARGNVGVRLGRECIKRSIPASALADYLGVSRQTVYNWFNGDTVPVGDHREAIEDMLKNKAHLARLEV